MFQTKDQQTVHKGPDSIYFSLCGPYYFCCNCSTAMIVQKPTKSPGLRNPEHIFKNVPRFRFRLVFSGRPFLCLNFHAHQAASYIDWMDTILQKEKAYPKLLQVCPFIPCALFFLDNHVRGFCLFFINIILYFLQTFHSQFEKKVSKISVSGRISKDRLFRSVLHYYQNENC